MYNPKIIWRAHVITLTQPDITRDWLRRVSDRQTCSAVQVMNTEFRNKLKTDEYLEVCRVKISGAGQPAKLPAFVAPLISECSDCFPSMLPDALPPRRNIEFELNMKTDARPSTRPPFRLSRTKQLALDKFVRNCCKKGWIEVSDSP